MSAPGENEWYFTVLPTIVYVPKGIWGSEGESRFAIDDDGPRPLTADEDARLEAFLRGDGP